MKRSTDNALPAALIKMLRPLVRILLRNGTSFRTFSDLAKWVFVDIARKEHRHAGRKPSISSIAVLTGLSRKEVKRVIDLPPQQDREAREKYNRAARVISGWRRDSDFHSKSGKPADLPLKGADASFEALVKRYSGDLPHRAVLDELLRVEAVSFSEQNIVRLLTRYYLPKGNDLVKIHILGSDVGHLIATIDHNLTVDQMPRGEPFFQRKVSYDNLPDEVLADTRRMVGREAQAFLEQLDASISKLDRDVNHTISGSGRNVVGLGIYYFEKSFEDENDGSG